ncbi:MAG: hypothetical protein AB1483_08935 [Candidatus Zixiibacteriota bacterium]
MKKTLTLLVALLFATSAFGQLVDDAKVENVSATTVMGVQPAVSSFSLIDLSRVKWSHSYSVSFFSGGSYSGTAGLWNSSMFYDISSKLSLTVNLGVAHGAGSIYDNTTDAVFLPGFMLDYHPSDNFRMVIGVQRYSGYGVPYYYYRPSYWGYPFGY